MKFTYSDYRRLIGLVEEKKYTISSYHEWEKYDRCVILRHDIDYSLEKAVMMAEFEETIGVKSTYFVLLTSDFYNLFSKKSSDLMKRIKAAGHEIGLHFDEIRYSDGSVDVEMVKEKIIAECKCLESIICQPVTSVSMHRPSKAILESNMIIPGVVNSYGSVFFHEFKYLSDSRRRWREPIEEIIRSAKYNKLHILTHAFWYNKQEISIHDSIKTFVNSANCDRYNYLSENITDLDSIMNSKDIMGDK